MCKGMSLHESTMSTSNGLNVEDSAATSIDAPCPVQPKTNEKAFTQDSNSIIPDGIAAIVPVDTSVTTRLLASAQEGGSLKARRLTMPSTLPSTIREGVSLSTILSGDELDPMTATAAMAMLTSFDDGSGGNNPQSPLVTARLGVSAKILTSTRSGKFSPVVQSSSPIPSLVSSSLSLNAPLSLNGTISVSIEDELPTEAKSPKKRCRDASIDPSLLPKSVSQAPIKEVNDSVLNHASSETIPSSTSSCKLSRRPSFNLPALNLSSLLPHHYYHNHHNHLHASATSVDESELEEHIAAKVVIKTPRSSLSVHSNDHHITNNGNGNPLSLHGKLPSPRHLSSSASGLLSTLFHSLSHHSHNNPPGTTVTTHNGHGSGSASSSPSAVHPVDFASSTDDHERLSSTNANVKGGVGSRSGSRRPSFMMKLCPSMDNHSSSVYIDNNTDGSGIEAILSASMDVDDHVPVHNNDVAIPNADFVAESSLVSSKSMIGIAASLAEVVVVKDDVDSGNSSGKTSTSASSHPSENVTESSTAVAASSSTTESSSSVDQKNNATGSSTVENSEKFLLSTSQEQEQDEAFKKLDEELDAFLSNKFIMTFIQLLDQLAASHASPLHSHSSSSLSISCEEKVRERGLDLPGVKLHGQPQRRCSIFMDQQSPELTCTLTKERILTKFSQVTPYEFTFHWLFEAYEILFPRLLFSDVTIGDEDSDNDVDEGDESDESDVSKGNKNDNEKEKENEKARRREGKLLLSHIISFLKYYNNHVINSESPDDSLLVIIELHDSLSHSLSFTSSSSHHRGGHHHGHNHHSSHAFVAVEETFPFYYSGLVPNHHMIFTYHNEVMFGYLSQEQYVERKENKIHVTKTRYY